MVKIRYAELPAGLHVATEDHGDCTIVYLLPGLTPPQRRAALTFARRAARMGHGPSLPRVDMAFALAADRVRTTARTITHVLRRHPMLLLPLVVIVSAVIIATMLSFVTVSISPLSSRITDPPAHAARHHSGVGSGGRPHSGAAGPSLHGSATTPNPEVSAAARAAVLRVSDGTASDTPSSGGAPQHRPHQLCVTAGRLILCVGS